MAETPVHITYDAAVTLLRRAVLEKGRDHVYAGGDSCTYFDSKTGAPDCIIGHVLSYRGITLEDIGGLNRDFAVDNLIGPNRWITVDNDRTADLLVDAQTLQDDGEPWGQAVDRAVAGNTQPAEVTVS